MKEDNSKNSRPASRFRPPLSERGMIRVMGVPAGLALAVLGAALIFFGGGPATHNLPIADSPLVSANDGECEDADGNVNNPGGGNNTAGQVIVIDGDDPSPDDLEPGEVFSGICLKTGTAHTAEVGNGNVVIDGIHCFTISGIGTNQITITVAQTYVGEKCGSISHADLYWISVTATPTATNTATATATNTATATATPTLPIATETQPVVNTSTPTATPTRTPTPNPSNTPTNTSVPTNTPVNTSTPVPTLTNTPVPTNTVLVQQQLGVQVTPTPRPPVRALPATGSGGYLDDSATTGIGMALILGGMLISLTAMRRRAR